MIYIAIRCAGNKYIVHPTRVCQVFCVNGVFVNLREPGFQI